MASAAASAGAVARVPQGNPPGNGTAAGHGGSKAKSGGMDVPVVAREWLSLEPPGDEPRSPWATLTVGSYNVLAQCLVKRDLFPYTSKQALTWKRRSLLLLRDVAARDLDVVCLQEVDRFDDWWAPQLEALGYAVKYSRSRTKQHGLALAFRKSRLALRHIEDLDLDGDLAAVKLDMQTGSIAQLAIFDVLGATTAGAAQRERQLVITNTHLCWRPFANYVRVKQGLQIKRAALAHAPLPVLMCGDFNATPDDALYDLMTRQRITRDEERHLLMPRSILDGKAALHTVTHVHDMALDQLAAPADLDQVIAEFAALPAAISAYGTYQKLDERISGTAPPPTRNGSGHLIYDLTSPFWAPYDDEPYYTNFQAKFKGTLDYLFLVPGTSHSCRIEAVLRLPSLDEVAAQTALPSDSFGSDHLLIACRLAFYP